MLATQLHLQLHHESGAVSAMGILWVHLVQSTENWLGTGEKGKGHLENDGKVMYAAKGDKRQKVKGAFGGTCSMFTKH